jgi:hypothetical protein
VCEPQNAEIQTAEEKTTMIYLLHYDSPLHHAQHYLGSCDDAQRIQDHGNGTSRARLPQVFCQLGVQFIVARTWEGGRTGERKLKNQKNARVLCPICRSAKLSVRAKQKRERRRQRKLPFSERAWRRPGRRLLPWVLVSWSPLYRRIGQSRGAICAQRWNSISYRDAIAEAMLKEGSESKVSNS